MCAQSWKNRKSLPKVVIVKLVTCYQRLRHFHLITLLALVFAMAGADADQKASTMAFLQIM